MDVMVRNSSRKTEVNNFYVVINPYDLLSVDMLKNVFVHKISQCGAKQH